MYFFKIRSGFLGHFEQYPVGSINTFKKIICDTPHSKHEVILVRRIDECVHYIYLCPLNKRDVFGIGVISDFSCTDYEQLVISFRTIVECIIREKMIITKVGDTYMFKPKSLLKEHVIIDIFLRSNDIHIVGNKINSISLSVSKSDKVECVFEERGSAWIVKQLADGYYNIDISYSGNRESSDEWSIRHGFEWGWKTWTLFCFLMALILTTAFFIFSNPQLKSQFQYTIEKYIL